MEIEDLQLENTSKWIKLKEKLSPLILSKETLVRVSEIFKDEMREGLKYGLQGSSLQMENTFVREFCNGTESGNFMALDLGGTNFRVLTLEMQNGKIQRERIEYYEVPEDLRHGEGIKLFDFLAESIRHFLIKFNLETNEFFLGFTFSFPMTQKALDSGYLVSWTKSFSCSGVVNHDAAQLLRNALSRAELNSIHVVAILNDTTGTLVRGTFENKDVGIGLIIATGCNAAYLENDSLGSFIMDPEIGAFGDNGKLDFLKSSYDLSLDSHSLLPNSFTYEKYIGGQSLGELLRYILIDCADSDILSDSYKEIFSQKGILTAKDLTFVETNGSRQLLKSLSVEASEDDVKIVDWIVRILGQRAACLISVPLSVFLQRMNRKRTTVIAVTGSLYKHHPRMKESLEYYVKLLSPETPFEFILTEDGSGKGAALLAAIVSRNYTTTTTSTEKS